MSNRDKLCVRNDNLYVKNHRGIRVFVRLMDERMRAYQAPVVEVVPLDDRDWEQLAWPDEIRSVDAADLMKWLSQVYPPGVMERTNPVTKRAYQIESVQGMLSLAPAGESDSRRYATLSGTVRLADEGEDGFSYAGTLSVVLAYERSERHAVSLRGVFEGTYPRYNRVHNRSFSIPLHAAFESLPE